MRGRCPSRGLILDVLQGPFGNDRWEEFSQQLARAQGVILYHGTSTAFLQRIIEEGILPRKMTGNSTYAGRMFGEKNLESQEDLVYLIHRSMIGFGGNAAVAKHGGELVALRTYIPDTRRLVPDEDSRKKTWHDSVAWEDSCAHRGAIPPAQILGYVQRTRRCGNDVQYTPLRADPPGVISVGTKR